MSRDRRFAQLTGTPDNAAAQLHELLRHRQVLLAAFQQACLRLPRTHAAFQDWAAAALELTRANAGAACLLAFWSATTGAPDQLALLAMSGHSCAGICRRTGSRAALACLQSLPAVLSKLRDEATMRRWWQGLERLSREAPDCVTPAASRPELLLADRTGEAFSQLVAAGLKAHGRDAAGRLAFFSLSDPAARALLGRRAGLPDAASLSRMLGIFSTALWGGDAARLGTEPNNDGTRIRASICGRVVLLPPTVEADTEGHARRLYLATTAHAGAHLALGPVCHPVGALKPLQLVLVTLIEDARVEALAMRHFPGLRRLWQGFHVPRADRARTTPGLMARLSLALFDPTHQDPDGFVTKASAMFAAEAERGLEDPALSLRLGRALGHDLGQMRVQFDWRAYVIEPPYRDDGSHLWAAPDIAANPIELATDAGQDGRDPQGGSNGEAPTGSARALPPDERGPVIATYPEWDAAAGLERPGWTTLRDTTPRLADPDGLLSAFEREAALRRRVDRLVRAAGIGRPVRLRRQTDGDELDLDAALDAVVALRSGLTPDTRLFRASRRTRDLATLIMLDTSASMAARLPDGSSVLDMQRLAVGLLAQALDANGDRVALSAFSSDGRDDVRLAHVKTFPEPLDATTLSRLAGLRPQFSTRLGAALRHARTEFAAEPAWRRLLLVLTDAEPSDVDVADSRDLVIDARRAVLGLNAAGIDVFGLVLDPDDVGSSASIFGRANTFPVRSPADLPARLAALYFRVARR